MAMDEVWGDLSEKLLEWLRSELPHYMVPAVRKPRKPRNGGDGFAQDLVSSNEAEKTRPVINGESEPNDPHMIHI